MLWIIAAVLIAALAWTAAAYAVGSVVALPLYYICTDRETRQRERGKRRRDRELMRRVGGRRF